MQLMAETTGTAYDDARYKVEWSIEDTEARNNIASIEQSATNKMIAIVRALSPGTVTVTVTVKDAMNGDAVLGSTTCNINVMFGVDTSNNDTIFKKMFETDTDRSLVLYADDAPVQMGLNFGKVEDAQWSVANDEIVQVGKSTGIVTPRGARPYDFDGYLYTGRRYQYDLYGQSECICYSESVPDQRKWLYKITD